MQEVRKEETVEKEANAAVEKIDANTLLTEVRLAIRDCFVGFYQEEENGLTIRFLNGQKFRFTLEETTD